MRKNWGFCCRDDRPGRPRSMFLRWFHRHGRLGRPSLQNLLLLCSQIVYSCVCRVNNLETFTKYDRINPVCHKSGNGGFIVL